MSCFRFQKKKKKKKKKKKTSFPWEMRTIESNFSSYDTLMQTT